ncbi:MAG: glutamate racemase [Anaerolineae bacterium]|nr:MAG: glutamate racemase [Anaerolineae bacterium]
MKVGAGAGGPIGVFDSGIGGFSVLRVLQAQLPNEDFIFFGDQGHIPYGPRSLEEVRGFSEAIVRFLLAEGSKLIVVACNTASAAALVHLRKTFPDVPFVGMEPAVKPAAETTQSGVVGVIATKATFQGELYASVVERFAQDVIVLQATCPGLVEEIEAGRLEGEIAREILEIALRPMMMKGIDAVVLGCTHYPFVENLIRELVGHRVRIIEPSGAIARQVERLLDEHKLRNPNNQVGTTRYFTSGKSEAMEEAALQLLGVAVTAEGIGWESGEVSRG